jgi:hypothetical protein
MATRWNHLVQSRDGSRLLAAFVGDEAADDLGDGFVLARPRHREPVVERQAGDRCLVASVQRQCQTAIWSGYAADFQALPMFPLSSPADASVLDCAEQVRV